jgi:hypothetical protein
MVNLHHLAIQSGPNSSLVDSSNENSLQMLGNYRCSTSSTICGKSVIDRSICIIDLFYFSFCGGSLLECYQLFIFLAFKTDPVNRIPIYRKDSLLRKRELLVIDAERNEVLDAVDSLCKLEQSIVIEDPHIFLEGLRVEAALYFVRLFKLTILPGVKL